MIAGLSIRAQDDKTIARGVGVLVAPGLVAAPWLAAGGAWAMAAPGAATAGVWLLSAAGVAALWRRRSHGGEAVSAFRRLHGRGTHPAALVDGRGLIRAVNAAGQSHMPEGARIDEMLDPGLVGQGVSAYRIARQATTDGTAHALLALSGRDWHLSVEPVREDMQLWRMAPANETAAGTPDNFGPAELMEPLPVALARIGMEGVILSANAAARTLLGAEQPVGRLLPDLVEGLGKSLPDRLRDTFAGRAQGRSEIARRKDSEHNGFLQLTMTRMNAETGQEILAVISDATELKTLEAQFVQSQKMQAVGQLAGGIAHDFNNLLTAINGHCDLLLLKHLQGDADHSDLMQIRQNANRAAALVRQLLAFSRKQTLRPQSLHLFDTLAELANLLDRLLGEKVALEIANTEDIWPIRADERQLEQVIVNLVVNARDAMPAGGVVQLRTRKATLDAPLERDRALVPAGDYALIEVEDSGTGIPKDKIGKIFEPFFTTKRVGEGTGLGLSTAYGIIKQMDGFIFVDSTVGEGTLFQIYLPAETVSDVNRSEPAPPARSGFRDTTGRGVVLLVEDEAPVRAFAARALQMRGYTVLEADCGEAALEILEDRDLKIDLFVSDVIMPGIDGPTWVSKAYETRPSASTVFVSGYSEDVFADGKAAVPRSSYLSKPFTLNDLVERVRDHMDRYVT